MGYEADVNITETYHKALLEAPREPKEKVFGNAKTIESGVQTLKRRKKREKYTRSATKQAKEIKENIMNITRIKESDLEGLQLKAHISLVGTSSESEIPAEFKGVDRKRKPSLVPSPTPKKTRKKQ